MSNKKKDIEKWLTLPQQETLDILKSSSKKGVLITSGDISKQRGQVDRTWTYKVLKSLIEKGLVERVNKIYYKIKD